MITRSIKRISLRALIVDDELGTPTAEGRAARALVTEMQGRNIEVIEALSAEDGRAVIGAHVQRPPRARRGPRPLELAPFTIGGSLRGLRGGRITRLVARAH